MMSIYKSPICVFGKYMQNNLPLMLGPINLPVLNDTSQQVRYIKKHYNPKFRKERKNKVVKVELMKEIDSDEGHMEHIRSGLKKRGLLPQRNWQERPICLHCTPEIYEGYTPPEGDGKYSTISIKGAKQKFEGLGEKSKSFLALRKIKSYEDDFTVKSFGEQALDIYKKAHEALCTKDENEILRYVTEHAYTMMIYNMMDKTIVWKYLKSLEPPRIVHVRVGEVMTKQNKFGQITVRFHSQQLLAIYDRFGRLQLGSETVEKDVLDYIVFEKHLSNEYGIWRMHGKIVPNWMKPQDVPLRSYILPKEESFDVSIETLPKEISSDFLNTKVKDASAD